MNTAWAAVDSYFQGLLIPDDGVLDVVLRSSEAAGLPAINVSPLQGKLLNMLVRLKGARKVLEIGTLAGYSAIWMGRALPAGGKLITLEAEARHVSLARANLEEAGLNAKVEVQEGLALEILPKILASGEGPFDMVFVDADKPNNPDYFAWALRLTAPGSLIVVDNVVRNGAVVDPNSTDPSVRGVQRFAEIVAREPRVTATVVQTVGGKGYDGFMIMLVNG